MTLKRYYSAAILSALCLLTIGLFVRLLHDTIPIAVISFYRAFFAFIFLLGVAHFIDKDFWKITWKDARDYAIVGFLLALTMIAFNTALTLAPLTDVYFLNYVHVFIAPIAAVFLLKEKFSKKNIALTILGIVGIALINPFSGKENLGSLLALVAGTSYALMTVVARRVDKHHSLGDVAWFMGFASLFLLPFGMEKGLLHVPSGDWIPLMAMGIVTGFGYLFYNIALGKLRVHTISMLDLIITTTGTILLSSIYFQESLPPFTLIGGVLVATVGVLFALESRLLDAGLKLPSHASLGYDPRPRKGKSRRARGRNIARK